MKFSSEVSSFFDIADDAAVVFCAKGEKPAGDVIEKIDVLTDGVVGDMFKSGEFDGSAGSEGEANPGRFGRIGKP